MTAQPIMRQAPMLSGDTSKTMCGFPLDECFMLHIADNGMSPTFQSGDDIFAHRQQNVDNGDVAVITLDGDNALLRRVFRDNAGHIVLRADNSLYEPIVLTSEEADDLYILGKVFRLMRQVTGF